MYDPKEGRDCYADPAEGRWMMALTATQKADCAWEDALDQLDDPDDPKKRLCQLLRSDIELSPKAREWLADLIECRCVPLPRGRRKTLAYTQSAKAIDHFLALDDVRRYRKEGDRYADPPEGKMSLKDALQKAAKVNGLTVTALKLSRAGQHRSFSIFILCVHVSLFTICHPITPYPAAHFTHSQPVIRINRTI